AARHARRPPARRALRRLVRSAICRGYTASALHLRVRVTEGEGTVLAKALCREWGASNPARSLTGRSERIAADQWIVLPAANERRRRSSRSPGTARRTVGAVCGLLNRGRPATPR